ncbi:MAG TPA: hypothetical protein PKY82_18010 [Pyrinomonadaceae bacterium]|nr:hypothetical protein [Pyrinomonadaceae bacterium]
MKLRNLILFVFLLFILSNSVKVLACSCAAVPTLLDAFEESKMVITGKLISIEKAPTEEEKFYIEGIKSVKMLVEKVFKGNVKAGDILTFGQGSGGMCRGIFLEKYIDEKYLLYLEEPELDKDDSELRYYTNTCGRPGLNSEAKDLEYLENFEKYSRKSRVAGQLYCDAANCQKFSYKKVKIFGKKKTYEVKTDKYGYFEIFGLPAGKYLIKTEIPNGLEVEPYFTTRYSPSIVRFNNEFDLGPKQQIEIILKDKRHADVYIWFTKKDTNK